MLFIIALAAAIVAMLVYFNAKKRFNKQESNFALIGFVIAVFIALLQCWSIIPAGHVGVIDFFGNVSDNTLYPGVNLVNPMANVIKFDARTQELKEVMNVPSKEGMSVELEISLLYSLSFANANKIYKTVGEDYVEKILIPQFRSVVRGVTASYDAKALYTEEREILSKRIETDLAKLVEARGITLEAAPLRQIILPPGLTGAIEEKLKAEQESQRMQFILQRETQEAERKRIEAQGVADFQKIVSQGISEQLLKWKGIEATEKLANSANSKVVIIGSGKDGLPIILGNQ
ncbi:MAG: membrane protease subunit, stomatin/prohibitin [Ignavibacteria bacterium GWA2_35_9]|nr:MAG: membrane protease subunit, stomatin/prohibitin [Ignavibacteria bacterium GWA2_35_9]OGU51572.1 MAG: membrane protease subunit, stomatin/prohibitin [Ignavibacteria bacterium GWC2_36_12]OGU99375.1 MAG: membrane protease subunit, stomatin/prohibitin [Ignavibacteria bacterium RIFOXYA2_FULL_37_17]